MLTKSKSTSQWLKKTISSRVDAFVVASGYQKGGEFKMFNRNVKTGAI